MLGTLTVFVAGKPATQGSKRHVGNGIMVEAASKTLKPWRQDIREACLTNGHPTIRITGPVAIRLDFVLPRPLSTPKRRTPPAVKKPDVDKLARAVLDAISSAGIWEDDSRVVDLHPTKRLAELGETPGCHIHIRPAEGHDHPLPPLRRICWPPHWCAHRDNNNDNNDDEPPDPTSSPSAAEQPPDTPPTVLASATPGPAQPDTIQPATRPDTEAA